jgi:hypothetical protein
MQKLNLPAYEFRIKKDPNNKLFIFDAIRQKNIHLTPEEWVRQNMVRFLIEEKEFPAPLISIESGVKINQLSRRYDALVYNKKGKPILLIECKAPSVKIKQNTFDQTLAYNHTIKANYILVTNGIRHYCGKINVETKKFDFLEDIPVYSDLSGD